MVAAIDIECEDDPEDEAFAMLKPLLAPPIDFKLIWDDRKTGGGSGVSIWQPIPPPSYVALGFLATKHHLAVRFTDDDDDNNDDD